MQAPVRRDFGDVSPQVRKIMRRNSARSSRPEAIVRSALWNAGLKGYRKNVGDLPGKPDVVYAKRKLCVFIHGCFWHSCPRCRSGKTVAKNASYWERKLLENAVRDDRDIERLKQRGFRVLILWECEVKSGLADFVTQVAATLADGC